MIDTLFSPDEQWLGWNSGGSSLGPIELFRVQPGISEPITVVFPSEMTADAGPNASPRLVGFTASDGLIVSVGTQLWTTSRAGGDARQLSVPDTHCCAVSTTEQFDQSPGGDLAVLSQTYNSNGDPLNTTDLLAPSGAVIHQFGGGSPLYFSPDGTYLAIDQLTATSDADTPPPEEVCDVKTYACSKLPGQAAGWLPNDDLEIDGSVWSAGSHTRWWNVRTGKFDVPPSVFDRPDVNFNVILPTPLIVAVRAAILHGPHSD
jgi:hypothetical protein